MSRRREAPAGQAAEGRRDWRSFDAVAETYERVRAPVHEAPARDLVAAVAPPPGGRVLDVGAGTGVATLPAAEAVGPRGTAVALDPSVPMLHVARAKGLTGAVGGEAIDLPFPDETFDAVLAAFVIFFFTSYETALFDMVRVLRSGGRLGVTTWTGKDDEFTRAWNEVAESFVGRDLLRDAARRVAPWQEHFSDAGRLEDALREAGLRSITVERREYRSIASMEDHLASREASSRGRYMREMLGDSLWERFRRRIREEFGARFADPIGDTNEVLIGVGGKP